MAQSASTAVLVKVIRAGATTPRLEVKLCTATDHHILDALVEPIHIAHLHARSQGLSLCKQRRSRSRSRTHHCSQGSERPEITAYASLTR